MKRVPTFRLIILLSLIVVLWILFPAISSLSYGLDSMIRLDPHKSKDYDSIFVEGRTRPRLMIPWLSRSTPVDYMRLRYTPNAAHQEYGIMFVDPHTLAYAAYDHCEASPAHLANRLVSAQPILDWINSQPHSIHSSSHVEDADEIYSVINTVRTNDLEHFRLPSNLKLQNYSTGFQSPPKKSGPTILSGAIVFMVGLSLFMRSKRR